MEQKLEPTTGEIVQSLRDEEVCQDVYWCDKAADRLESQEKDIAELKNDRSTIISSYAEMSVNVGELIKTLAARAEQAEAREKAIIESLRDRCEFCIGYELEESDDPCNTCYNARTFDPDDIPRTKNWKWRGLPQDGEGL